MDKKALILDLDNTIYSVKTIGDELFRPLFSLIKEDGQHNKDMDEIKEQIMRRPFQWVAGKYNFSEGLKEKAMDLLKDTTYTGMIKPFIDYSAVKDLEVGKYLVTTGFLKLQQSKITGMKIQNDFREIHIVDPYSSTQTKKDVFAEIIYRHQYAKSEVLVVGDDPESEIKAAQELGVDAILYDRENRYPNSDVKRIKDFRELKELLKS